MEKIDIGLYVELGQAEIKLVAATFRDRGANRFARALLLAVLVPGAVYYLLYSPARRKLANLGHELAVARIAATHSDTYKQLQERLSSAYAKLPLPKDRGAWISDTVKDALRAQEIVVSQFTPPTEEESGGNTIQTLSIKMTVQFAELMAFLARLEANKPVLRVTSLELGKKEQPGSNDVGCGISTLILEEHY